MNNGTPANGPGAIQARPHSLRCASPLPRAEVFCARPTSARPRALPPAPIMQLPPLPPSVLPAKQPLSPGSSITNSNSVSPSSSAASGASVSGLIRRSASGADGTVALPQHPDRATAAPGPEPGAALELPSVGAMRRMAEGASAGPRQYDIFEEDDYTDRFDSFNATFDQDAAMDEYLVFSRRYDSGIKMRREVREALPKKNVVGGALWERLYSDVSMQFTSGRDSADQRMPLRKMFSDADYSHGGKRQHPGRERFRAHGTRAAERDALPARAVSSNGLMVRPRRERGFANIESTRSVARDDFLEFQGFRRRGARKQKEAPKLLEACKNFLKSLVPKRRR